MSRGRATTTHRAGSEIEAHRAERLG